MARLRALHRSVRLRCFSVSPAVHGNRAIVYNGVGSPTSVLSLISFPSLPPPTPNTVNVKFLLSPINPADLNVIEGAYPNKPDPRTDLASTGRGSSEQPVFVPGNEGLAEITAVGKGVTGLKCGEWVAMAKQQAGTWISCANLGAHDVLKIPKVEGKVHLSEVQAATLTINPATAFRMLSDFVELQEGDWVLQNGANSSVGQAVIQIAKHRGLKTINFIRNRPDVEKLQRKLLDLGATHVLAYEELKDRSVKHKVKEWTETKDILLGLNCVGGEENSLMARLLGSNAHLVSYGAMSKQHFSLPTSLLIFKNLTCHGFWLSRWYLEHGQDEKEKMMETLAMLMHEGNLNEPEHKILTLGANESNELLTKKVHDIIAKISKGQYGRKILLKIEDGKEL